MRRVWLVVVPVFLFLIGAIWIAYRRSQTLPPAETPVPNQVLVNIPEGRFYGGGVTGRQLDVSPDGTRIVYVAKAGSAPRRLYVHVIGETNATEVPGTDGANDPAFSPDGRFIAYYGDGSVKKAALDGSGVTVIGKAPPLRGIAWLDMNTFILGVVEGNLLRMSAANGESVPILKAKGPSHLLPNVVPGNKAVLVTVANGPLENARIALVMLETGEEKKLLETNAFAPKYLPTGHIIYASGYDRHLMAVRFDPRKLEVIGSPQPVLKSRVSGQGSGGSTDFAISPTGTLVYTTPHEDSVNDIFAVMGQVDLTQIQVRLNWLDQVKQLVP